MERSQRFTRFAGLLAGCLCLAAFAVSGRAAAAINAATGNLYERETDYRAAAGGLSFSRSFNSKATTSGVLGHKWRHNWSASLKRVDLGTASYIVASRADGRSFHFTLSGGSWTSEPDIAARLTQSSGTYILTDGPSTRETYNSAGQLISLESAGGDAFTLAYSGNRLVAVTDRFDRSLAFGYDGNGRLQSLTNPDNQVTRFVYANDHLVSVTYPDGQSRIYHYENPDFPHRLTGITDENGDRYSTWAYDAQGRAVSSAHADGADSTSLAYNADGSTTVTDALGLVRSRTFQRLHGQHKAATTTKPCSSCGESAASQTYDANGFVDLKTDFNGHVTDYDHDARGLETQRIEARGTPQQRVISTNWHPSFRLPTEINEPGRRTAYSYDASGNRLTRTITDLATGDSRTTAYTYTAQGLLDTVDGPRTDVADITDFDYDTQGNLIRITNALNQVTQITAHDAHGNPLTVIDSSDVTTTLTYDLRQRLTSRTVAGAVTSFEYDGAGNLTKLTLPTGAFISYRYDAAHRLTDIQDNLGNRIHYTLDAAGNRIKEEVFDPANVLKRQLRQEYDQQGRLIKILGNNDQVTEYGYDHEGNRSSSTEAGSFTTHSEYDALDRIRKVTDAGNGMTEYGYNALSQLTAVKDPNGLSTIYDYNAFGEVTKLTSPDTGTTTYTYDSAGNRTSQTDARGITVTYRYDALGRITAQDYPGTAEDVGYFYDGINYGGDSGIAAGTPHAIGRLTGVADASGVQAYAYSSRGQLQERVARVDKITYRTRYEYDLANRLTRMIYPNGRSVTYERDALGRIGRVTSELAGYMQLLADDLGYLPFGPLARKRLANGVTEIMEFDLDYRGTRIQAGSLLERAYYYDARNNLEAIEDVRDGTRSQAFDYDPLSRLSRAQGGYGNLAWNYDAIGNRLSEIRNGRTSTYRYSAASHRLEGVETAGAILAFGYDAAGHATQKGNQRFSYNLAGRLHSASGRPDAGYVYDSAGQRIMKSIGGKTTVYHHDRDGRLIAETDARGNVQAEYVHLDGQLLARFDYRGHGKKLVYDTHYYHLDHLGTPQALSGSQQQLAWQADYEPFGAVSLRTGQLTENTRYPGQYYDAETGLHQNWHRDYDPSIGRYLQSDPIGLAGGINTYAYVASNPLVSVDPYGLDTAVVVGSPTGLRSNPFGHAAIATTGSGIYSFGTQEALGSSFEQYLQNQSTYRDSIVVVLKTTPDEEKQILDSLSSSAGIPLPPVPSFDSSDTCATRTNKALKEAGLYYDLFPSPLPSATLGNALLGTLITNGNIYYVPKGTKTIPPLLQQFNPVKP